MIQEKVYDQMVSLLKGFGASVRRGGEGEAGQADGRTGCIWGGIMGQHAQKIAKLAGIEVAPEVTF